MKETDDTLLGQLLIAVPSTGLKDLHRGVLLVTSNWQAGSTALMINKPLMNNLPVTMVMQQAGINYEITEPVFYGGGDENGKIQFVHTMDWSVPNTRHITSEIGVTSEVSILAAIARDQGPRLWRCIMGQRISNYGELESEVQGQVQWTNNPCWLTIPATPELIFSGLADEQWIHSIEEAGRKEVANWF